MDDVGGEALSGPETETMDSGRVLDKICAPCDLSDLDAPALDRLCEEIRDELVSTVSVTGGHLAPNLGVVELTIGIHRALNCPRDRIVFDVGHQSYVHKMLTGRCDAFDTLRQYGGISGFPKRSESSCDSFDSGHASDSLSIAMGLALARDARAGDESVLAVIGDGSLTGGMAFEALNHIGHLGVRLVVVLNDNEMSISENVGALASYLARVRLDPRYQRLREGVESRLATTSFGRVMVDAGEAVKESVKQLVVPGMFFEELGLKYVGPIDGHDISQVEQAVSRAKAVDGPVIIHAVTRKGSGYRHAEESPDAFHGVGPFSVDTGRSNGAKSIPSYTEAFSAALIREAERDERVVAITAAMPNGTGLDRFAERFPERFFDVGIAEEHAVGLSAGLALGGCVPVVAIYSTFLQRAYDQMMMDVALQGQHVVFCLDRAGVVGEDGPTHHGVFDLTYLRSIPGMRVLAPADEVQLAEALHTAIVGDGPWAIRYPRGSAVGVDRAQSDDPWVEGVSVTVREGRDVALIAVGRMVVVANGAARLLADRGVEATVVDARWVKPIDADAIARLARTCRLLVTIEENTVCGGFGSSVAETLAQRGIVVPLEMIAVPDGFVTHGAMKVLLEEIGLTADAVADSVVRRLGSSAGR